MCLRISIPGIFEWEGELYEIDNTYPVCKTCIFNEQNGSCSIPDKLIKKFKKIPQDPSLFHRGAIKKVFETEINY